MLVDGRLAKLACTELGYLTDRLAACNCRCVRYMVPMCTEYLEIRVLGQM